MLTLIIIFSDQCLKESTKAAAPAFTFAGKQEQRVKSIAPSPNTYNTAGLTVRGKERFISKNLVTRKLYFPKHSEKKKL